MAVVATVSNLAEKARDSTEGANRAYTNGRSREDKYSNSISKPTDRVCTLTRFICYGCGLGDKLL